jgi:hypothetical protein
MRIAAPIDDVWRSLLGATMLRGSLAGYTGTAVLEEADEDEHVARLRLQGTRDGSPATATLTAALSPAGDATEVDLRAEVFGGATTDEVLAAAAEAAMAALAAPDKAAPAAPPDVAAPDKAAPVAPPAVAAPDEVAPAAHGLSAPAKGALVAAGAALAVWALRGRR